MLKCLSNTISLESTYLVLGGRVVVGAYCACSGWETGHVSISSTIHILAVLSLFLL